MAKLVSMKSTRKEQQEKYSSPSEISPDAPVYPYGLRVNFDDDTMKKLKLAELPEVGKSMMLVARVDVISVSSNESSEGGKRESVELQITDLCLEKDAGEGGAADKLYDGAKAEK